MSQIPDFRKFTIYYHEEEEGGYSGQCAELPGAISQGETLEELKENMEDAITLILKSIQEEENIDENKKKKKIVIEVPSAAWLLSLRNHNSREVIKVLTNHYNFSIERQSGSHIQLKHPDGRRVTVPKHNPIKLGVMKSIISQAQTTEEEFLKYL